MAVKKMTSREFNQNTGGAKRAARNGPVYITDRGQPSHVLLTFGDFERLGSNQTSLIEALSEPVGIEDIEFGIPISREPAHPTRFD
jgi:PHD/YefM family antitoxin component YafN of YafNO toxin-antitoxin module